MPKDEKGKNRKFKHHKEREFTPLTQEQIDRAQKIARGQKVEEQQPQVDKEQKGEQKFAPRQLEQKRNFEMPADDSDEG